MKLKVTGVCDKVDMFVSLSDAKLEVINLLSTFVIYILYIYIKIMSFQCKAKDTKLVFIDCLWSTGEISHTSRENVSSTNFTMKNADIRMGK